MLKENPTREELMTAVCRDFESNNLPQYSYRTLESQALNAMYVFTYKNHYDIDHSLSVFGTGVYLFLNNKEGQEMFADIEGRMRYTMHCIDRYAQRYLNRPKMNKFVKLANFMDRNQRSLIVGPCANGIDGLAITIDGILLLDMSGDIPLAKTFITYSMLQPMQMAAISEAKKGNRSHAITMVETFKSLY